MVEALKEIKSLLSSSNTLPVLFVGSGLSQRYLGSPTWAGLLEYAATLVHRSLSYYEGLAADGPSNLRLPRIASRIAEDFYREWFDDPEYVASRDKYEKLVRNTGDPLKIELAQYLQGLSITNDETIAEEMEKLSAVRTHAVITTNYDSILEDALPDLELYVGQQSVLFSATQAVGEIYKIHGSAGDPTSMVLTDEDYKEYWARNPYLIAKVLTLFVEHPVIFLGYSLTDSHIQKLLGNLVECLTEEQLDTLNRRLIFVNRPKIDRAEGLRDSTITVEEHSFRVQELIIEDYGSLYDVLAELPQHFPVRLLRQLSESVYQLAYSSEPTGRVYVLPFEEAREDEVEVVVGVGTMERLGLKGYSAFTRTEFFLDMLVGATDHNVPNMMNELLPSVFRVAKFAPIWYPLFLAERAGDTVDLSALPRRARALLEGETALTPYPGRRPPEWDQLRFSELLASYPDLATNLGVGCRYELEDVLVLREYLRPELVGKTTIQTPLAKLCSRFDLLAFGHGFDGDRRELHRELGFKCA
ncbi:SIR2-like domain-containing protein [Paramicrobacterium humi]|uniref:SIR2-like domain-containing protein n=2 Tax=Paramicrobacterium humi TaxID=640635 RepID=A0A1H4K322_9MICO|nr:SIR2-like domain-containing protein [Microbacterium humi]